MAKPSATAHLQATVNHPVQGVAASATNANDLDAGISTNKRRELRATNNQLVQELSSDGVLDGLGNNAEQWCC